MIGLFRGLYRIDEAKRIRARVIEHAKRNLRSEKKAARDVLSEGYTFKRDEIRRGEPARRITEDENASVA